MIDGSRSVMFVSLTVTKNAVVKAAFELQSSHVCEKRRRLYGHVGVDQN